MLVDIGRDHGGRVDYPRARLDALGTPYEFVRRIGGGASSDVFEVVARNGEQCALKLLRAAHATSRELTARFVREARALETIVHPSLVPVIDSGSVRDGRPYFVMPLLQGSTLREQLERRGRFVAPDACEIMIDVLAGLGAAHRRGIVHRDVKPTNIFLSRSGEHTRAVLLDFGIAKVLDQAHPEIATGPHVIGTPRYLAPEQILGGEVDGRTDVYSAGLVLFEMLAGRDPFGACGAAEQMHAHVYGQPASLHEFALVSAELELAVARAIDRSPEVRWPSAAAFGAALTRARARYLRAPDLAARRAAGCSASPWSK